jgi:hypothetical protein
MTNNIFLTDSIAWLWIISAALVVTTSLYALVKVRFKIDRVGLLVIAFYNIVFSCELGANIALLANKER